LNEATSRVLVAEAGGKIVGFIVMQLYPHLEPLWVDKAHRSDGIAENLAAKMMEFLNEVEVRGDFRSVPIQNSQKGCARRMAWN
jgi:ribosomal protein S18 acetylase RimI-like enzyme